MGVMNNRSCLLFRIAVSGAWLGLVLLASAPAAGTLRAETLTYREVEGGAVATHVLSVRPEGSGFRVELATTRADGVVRQIFLTAADLTTLVWTFSDPARKMELAAVVQGEDIVLSGTFQGEKVAKKFPAAGPPWNQLFQVGLERFALSQGGSKQFRSIGTQGPGELKIGKFSVTRKADEPIDLAGKTVAAVHLRISLSGLLSVFWHGDYWYRRGDGRFLRYRGKNRPGGAVAVSELVGEEKVETP
jgi:hypothetical protein